MPYQKVLRVREQVALRACVPRTSSPDSCVRPRRSVGVHEQACVAAQLAKDKTLKPSDAALDEDQTKAMANTVKVQAGMWTGRWQDREHGGLKREVGGWARYCCCR